jgi:hypothetical protein
MNDATLPPLYDRWATEALGRALPAERASTCNDCLLCEPTLPEARQFNAESKCCTYVPRLPNYLAGRVLADEDPGMAAGQAKIHARLRAGVGVHPLGLELSPDELAHYDTLVRSGAFGQGDLRCPYYVADGGLCGVWRHRNGVCSTWLCRHERGGRGATLWAAVEQWLAVVEDVVQRWAALKVRFGLVRDAATANDAIDGAQWGGWISDIDGFYRECAMHVGRLHWADVLQMDPERLAPALAAMQDALDVHDKPVSRGPLTYRGAITLEEGPTGRTWLVSPAHRFTFEAVPAELPKLLSTFVRGGFETLRHLLTQAGAAEPKVLAIRLIEDGVLEEG